MSLSNRRRVAPIVATIIAVLLVAACERGEGINGAEDGEATARDSAFVDSVIFERTACVGDCPHYRVVINRTGSISYIGYTGVERRGRWVVTVADRAIARLFARIQGTGLDRHAGVHIAGPGDLPATALQVWRSDRARPIHLKYTSGFEPLACAELFRAIDETLRGGTWTQPQGAR